LVKRQDGKQFQPYFRIQEVNRDGSEQIIRLTEQIIRDMTDRGQFCLDLINIDISAKESMVAIDLHLVADDRSVLSGCHGYAISGFPRTLDDDEVLKMTSKFSIHRAPTLPNLDTNKMLIIAAASKLSAPEVPQTSSKRLRHVRSTLPPRPVSDSAISRTSLSKSISAPHTSFEAMFAEQPESRRYSEADRPTPITVQSTPHMGYSALPLPVPPPYTLSAGSSTSLSVSRDAIPRTSATNLFGEFHHADEEKNLEEALRQSMCATQGQTSRPTLARADTTDMDELAMVLKISMYEQ
jgi:hypothetical protein